MRKCRKKILSTAIFIGNTFSSFSTWKYFLRKSLVTFCFNLRKSSCFINQSTSYFAVKILISEFRVACLCIFFVFSHFQIGINRDWMRKNPNTVLYKKTNLWTFDALNDFFWNFYEKLELVKVKKCWPGSNCFLCQEVQIILNFPIRLTDTSMINPASQNKSWVTFWKKMCLLLFLGGSK